MTWTQLSYYPCTPSLSVLPLFLLPGNCLMTNEMPCHAHKHKAAAARQICSPCRIIPFVMRNEQEGGEKLGTVVAASPLMFKLSKSRLWYMVKLAEPSLTCLKFYWLFMFALPGTQELGFQGPI